MYLIEKDQPGSLINTYADSLWWGVVNYIFKITKKERKKERKKRVVELIY
jgi:hypothetical protein